MLLELHLTRIKVEAFVETLCNDCHHWMLEELRPAALTSICFNMGSSATACQDAWEVSMVDP